jgi:hypothetical protein
MFVPHRRHITSPLQNPASYCYVRDEDFTPVTIKNVVFWDTETQFVLHRGHTSPLQSPAGEYHVRLQIFKAAAMKNDVFWVVTQCDSYKNRRFGCTCSLHHEGDKNQRTRNNISNNGVSSLLILVPQMMEATRSSETSVLKTVTRRNIQEDGILTLYMFLISHASNLSASSSMTLTLKID